jgi:hypothetical protein
MKRLGRTNPDSPHPRVEHGGTLHLPAARHGSAAAAGRALSGAVRLLPPPAATGAAQPGCCVCSACGDHKQRCVINPKKVVRARSALPPLQLQLQWRLCRAGVALCETRKKLALASCPSLTQQPATPGEAARVPLDLTPTAAARHRQRRSRAAAALGVCPGSLPAARAGGGKVTRPRAAAWRPASRCPPPPPPRCPRAQQSLRGAPAP